MARYEVANYSEGLWCIVDSTKFLSERERLGNWPMQLHDHPLVGYIPTFTDRNEALRLADGLNNHDRNHDGIPPTTATDRLSGD